MLEALSALLAVSLVVLIALLLRSRRRLAGALAQVEELSKYEAISDAESAAQAVIRAAEEKAAGTVANAQASAAALLANARADSAEQGRRLLEESARAQTLRVEAEHASQQLLRQANEAATKVIADAEERAKETAGEALKALRNVTELKATAQALKNVVEGYGDQYIIPSFTLLDGLADTFGFTEAGEKLKAARALVRSMVRSGEAAACDYVELNRKKTAIDFVVDAFNGKADSILAEVKEDNFGTLERRLHDAFHLVNQNGQAFRNARINIPYLETRLEELRWACRVVELKRRDREEQRALKEKMREEERAQKEFERSLREAEKEEEMLRKAMAKVQLEVERASDEQRAKYEAQLAQLAQKLAEAEEKGRRAISMAQQTKAGHVYVISNTGSFGEHVYKIGLTRRLEPQERIDELGDASVPFEFDVHALIRSDDAPSLERELHKKFLRHQMNKVNPRKEFFRVDLTEIKREVESIGLQVQWSLAADCREFRESQAIDRAVESAGSSQEVATILEGMRERRAQIRRRGSGEITASDGKAAQAHAELLES